MWPPQPTRCWSWDITTCRARCVGDIIMLPDRGHLQPQGRGLGGLRAGKRRAGGKLLQRSVIGEQCLRQPLVLHSGQRRADEVADAAEQDARPGITPSRGRPRVSNDNPTRSHCFEPEILPCNGRRMALPIWTRHGPGSGTSCVGTTMNTAITASASSRRPSAIAARIIRC